MKNFVYSKNVKMITFFLATTSILMSCDQSNSKKKESKSNENESTVPPQSGEGKKEDVQNSDAEGPSKTLKTLTIDFETAPIKQITDIPELKNKPETIRKDLMDAFCIHVYKLPLQDPENKFQNELGVLCGPDKKPTPMFSQIDRYTKVNPEATRGIEISSIIDGDYHRSLVISAVSVPIPPKFVKEAKIQSYMTAPANFGYFTQESGVKKDLNSQIGGDLGFARYELFYTTKNTTNDGKTFRNERSSQFNAYQVQGGNPDIGLGTEHLIGNNSDYRFFKTITVTIGNVDGGSTIISIGHVDVKHNQYPKDARRLAIDTATATSQHVRAGVLAEMKDRIISK